MKRFKCGICKPQDRKWMFRKEFRDHLKTHTRNNLFNDRELKYAQSRWKPVPKKKYVIEEEW